MTVTTDLPLNCREMFLFPMFHVPWPAKDHRGISVEILFGVLRMHRKCAHMKSQKSCQVLDGVDSRDRREVVELCVQQYRQQRLFLPFVAVCLPVPVLQFLVLLGDDLHHEQILGTGDVVLGHHFHAQPTGTLR